MTETSQPQVMMSEIMRDAPRNWGRWGDSDQVGALNLLTPEVIAGGAAEIREGRTFTLGASLGGPDGEPVWPGRAIAQRVSTRDRASYSCGKAEPFPGGME